ncbi:MAG TPA: ATP-binding protein, partial [Blastocatellia bacterium]|nr:ATP-binding protein [Blastocatellia bacterium]
GKITHWVSIQRDITERRRAEEELRQSQAQLAQAQKMEAVGRLAGGIAHDFNNLLTVIMGFSQLLMKRLGPEHPLQNEVEQIREAGERAAALTSQLLAFSRKQVAQPRVINLGEVVNGVKKILQRLIGEDIELTTVIDHLSGGVNIDQGQIEQVIFNLVVNARDAMEKGGKLTIGVNDVDLDDAYARTHISARPGPYTVMTVTDTGKGMDAETKAHIFEPFFTTKEMGRGTGLGLAMVYGIVKQNNGFIWVYSEPGVGTTFKIYFPRIDGETEEVKNKIEKNTVLPRGTEVVLLAEDEVAVRRLTRELLEMQGYTVIEAASGEEALQLGRQHSQIDLLLTDVIMPRLSGRELASQLSEMRPNLKVLYMSGYTDDTIVRHGLLEDNLA